MDTAETCSERAHELRQRAEATPLPRQKEILLAAAERWDEMGRISALVELRTAEREAKKLDRAQYIEIAKG
jgi:hypothetical protein